jgi:hypothetical protein
MLPDTCALSGNNPINAIAVCDFPEPDSPTRPTDSPRLTEKLTASTTTSSP